MLADFERKQIRALLHASGTCVLPTKTTSRGQIENPAYISRGETTCPSASIPGTRHQKDQGQDEKNDKLAFLVQTSVPGATTIICCFWTTPGDLTFLCVICTRCTLSRPISHRTYRKSLFGNHRCVDRVIACND